MRTIWIICALLCPGATFAQCGPAQYHKGLIILDEDSLLIMNISIPLSEFGPRSLACLAADLNRIYRSYSIALINIFSSDVAADQATRALQEYSGNEMRLSAQMHAQYNFNREGHEEYLLIMPVGTDPNWDSKDYSTRIKLPVRDSPHCSLEIDNRCLVALKNPRYPYELYSKGVSGVVTMTGIVAPDGSVGQVQAVSVLPMTVDAALVSAAVANLSTWHLEPAERQETLRITFRYQLDASLKLDAIRWDLPNEVIMRARPRQ